MRKIGMMAAGILLSVSAQAANVIAESGFSGADRLAEAGASTPGKGVFQGVLPGGWRENFTSWTTSRVTTARQQEGTLPFLSFKVQEIGGASPQFVYPLPPLRKEGVYRLSVLVRNRSSKDAALALRMIPAPYRTAGTIHIPPSRSWKSLSGILRLKGGSVDPAGLFLTLNGVGELDLQKVLLEELTPAEVKAADAAARTILQTVFFVDAKDGSGQGKGMFRGVLPAPWRQDYTHWNAARAGSEIINRGPEHFLRLKVESGSPQFLAPLSGIRPNRTYRLTAYFRNRTGGAVKLSLRLLPPPYSTLASGALKRTDSWTSQTIYFKTQTFDSALPVGLLLNLDGPGDLDLVTLKLEEFDGAAAQLRRPSAALPNVLRSSRFPLGLPPGWNRMRGYADGSVKSSPDLRGPSGEAALVLRSRDDGQIGLSSEPFNVADPSGLHRFSFSCRGRGKFRAEIRCEGKTLASLPVSPDGEWKRMHLDFRVPPDALAVVFRIFGSGELALDAVRAAPAGSSEYLPAGECEIALALPESETQACGIQFEDEAPRIRYAVTGNCTGGVLSGKIVNLYGEEKALSPIPLTPERTSGTLSYALFPGRTLGQFRLELSVQKDGRPVSPPAEMVVTRIARPEYWKRDAPDSPFGIHVLADDPSLKAVKAAGINWVRFHDAGTEYTGWFYLEGEKGKWRFRDSEIDRFRNNHLKIFGQLGTAPKWASHLSIADTGRSGIAYHDRYFQPLNLEEFAAYVSTVVGRYRGKIDDWFVWNEPWVPGWWGIAYRRDSKDGGYVTSADPQADFAKLTRTAYAAAKKQNPGALISGFNTTAGAEGRRWTSGVLKSGGLECCDTIDFHFYTAKKTGFPGDACWEAWTQALGPILEKNGRIGKPVILSEGQGASLGSAAGDTSMRYAGFYNRTLPWKNEEDFNSVAERNVRYIVSFLSLGVKRIFLYSAHCYEDFSRAPSFLVLFNADGSPHPMLPACSAMARRLEDRAFQVRLDPGNGVHAYVFSGKKGGTVVFTGPVASMESLLKAARGTMTFYDLYGNPVVWPLSSGQELIYGEFSGSPDPVISLLSTKQGGHNEPKQ